MAPESSLEAATDRLYQLPLGEFVRARSELARQSGGKEAQAIRALAKPNIVAWALNQVYWSARPVFDRLGEAIEHLRGEQAKGLLNRPGDLRGADAAHRQALAAAIRQAATVLEGAGHDPTPDTLRALTAAFEALPWKERAGRLVRPPSSPGFGAFAGLPTASPVEAEAPVAALVPSPGVGGRQARARPAGRRPANARQEAAAERARQQHELEVRRQHAREALESAQREAATAAERQRTEEGRLARARDAERAARERLEELRREVRDVEASYRAAERDAASALAAVLRAETEARGSRGRR